ncbi:MAG: helix-turn-helix domain-containing protein [Cyclobacteriaceae bacterium]
MAVFNKTTTGLMTIDSELLQKLFSLKNSVEVAISLLALAQGLYFVSVRKKKPVLLIHGVFLILFGLHFGLLNILNIFKIDIYPFGMLILSSYGSIMLIKGETFVNNKSTLSLLSVLGFIVGIALVINISIAGYSLWNGVFFHLLIDSLIIVSLFKILRFKNAIKPAEKSWITSFQLIFLAINTIYIYVLYEMYFGSPTTYISMKLPVAYMFLFLLLNNVRFFIMKPHFLKSTNTHAALPNQSKVEELIQAMNCKMEEDQLYLDSNLELKELAQELGQPIRLVSEVLNTHLQKNFYQYVNEFRLKRAVDLMKSNDKLLKEIMYESGFNNKVTFSNIFKKEFGLTPSEVRKSFHEKSSAKEVLV